jgi:lycopene cyclase CruP
MLEPLLKDLPSKYLYYWHRWVDAWQYGSGGDYLGHK